MTPERLRQIEGLYHRAREREPNERAAFLAQACHGDEELRQELDQLLAPDSSSDNILDSPAADLLANTADAQLTTGMQIGPYKIEAELGAGGMGEVYRAVDTRLKRSVAIKVAKEKFGERFEREARAIAALNHPNICTLYDVGPNYLVMELIEGPTLADRIKQGAVPLDEALGIAKQIADALEAAHEKGIVHRDLKPGNIKIKPDGIVKVLDFGLAKAMSGSAAATTLSNSPTLVSGTMGGAIIGTAAYMSPEQARGLETDKRTDVWAFGCVLYEMLTGRTAFDGKTISDVIAAVLTRDVDFALLPASTPFTVRKIIERCLEKDRKRRLHDIADARIEIDGAPTKKQSEPAIRPRLSYRSWTLLGGLILVSAILGGVLAWYMKSASTQTPSSTAVARLVIAPTEALALLRLLPNTRTIAISPDGRRVVYAARTGDRQQLYIRDIDRFESRSVPGTDGAHTPVFSPDGRWLAFIAERKLKKVALDGGTPEILNDSLESYGLSWGIDDTILFNPGSAPGIWRVPANGGMAVPVTHVEGKEVNHRLPEMLPTGKAVLFTAFAEVADYSIYVQSLDTGRRQFLVKGVSPHYVPTGYLTFAQGETLFAVPFDLTRLELAGTPVSLVENVQRIADTPQIAFSATGSMIYLPATGLNLDTSLVWVDRDGKEQSTGASGRPFAQPRLAPEARRVGVALRATPSDLWSYDLMRETWSRLTYDGQSSFPLWTSDGRRLTYASGKRGPTNIFWKPTDGGESSDERLIAADLANLPLSWSPDGKTLAYVQVDPRTGQDIWTLNAGGASKPQPFLQTRFREGAPQFSPDGGWIAYVSDESGRNEIYVRPFPGPGDKWTVSTDGGNEPVWPRNAQQLFYRNGDSMMAVDVFTSPTFSAGKPRLLFTKSYEQSNAYWANYDVTPDGQRFLMVKGPQQAPLSSQIYVVLNWADELKQRVPIH